MTTISQADPTAEAVKNMFSPDQSGIAYVMKRYIVEDLASGNTNAFAFAVQNPEGVDCLVTNIIVDIIRSSDYPEIRFDKVTGRPSPRSL